MTRAILYIGLLVSSLTYAQPESAFNHKTVEIDSTGDYHFLVSGHFYGDGTNLSHYPANTLLGNLDWINNSDADMLVCLGDLFKDISNDIPNYEKSFFSKLDIPLYNAVGNHDLTGSIYQDNYGETYYSFELNRDIHIILDTELDNGDIENEQLKLIEDARARVNSGAINNVFIYAHRTVWKDNYEEMEGLFTDNTSSLTEPNFTDAVYPLIKEMSAKVPVYWFSGSLGPAPASFFYFRDTNCNFTIIATSIRALPRDAMLMVHVLNGEVSFSLHSLTGEELKELEEYNVELWQNEVGEEPFNWKLVPYYIQMIVTHRHFWYGMSFAFGLVLVIYWIRRKKRRL